MTELTAKTHEPVQKIGGSGRSLWAEAFRRLKSDPVAVICFAVICLYAAIAIFAPIVLGDWETTFDYDRVDEPPSWDYWLGTDSLGRSVLGKTLLGASVSMQVAFVANIVAVPLGIVVGCIAGYFGRFIDDAIVWLYTTLVCIPGLIRVIALKFAFQEVVFFQDTAWQWELKGMPAIIIALAMTSWIGTCRLVRAETMKMRELDYVMAARAAGRGSFSTMLRHIVPNVLHIGIINFSLGFVGAIGAEVSLSFLGIGVMDKPSWGKMISGSMLQLVAGRWWELAAATVAMFIIVLAWNIFGDRLRDALDPKLRNL
ncbi:MAG: ABC transporter permease [Phycisphaerae bacterium]